VELQSTSQRRSRRTSKQPPRPALGWTPLELARVVTIALAGAGPWYFASAPWLSQYWMVWASLALAMLMVCEILRRLWLKQEISKLSMPWLSVVFLGLASYGCVQAIPLFSVESKTGWTPPSVAIQRWFLGVPNTDLDTRFATLPNGPSETSPMSSTKPWFEDAKLSLSIEPMHSRAAVGGLAMVSLMIWIGATAFQTRRSQLALLIFMSTMGVAIGLVGLAHVLSWNRVNWLGLDSGNSFATFVSRNTAGGFLNVCLAGSIGFAAWAFSQPRDKEQRYSYGSESPALRFIHTFEDIFAQLTTMQISALLSTSFILIAVFCTGSRGASISAVVACLIALLVSQRDKKSQVGLWCFAFFVIAIGLTGIYFFELDQRITSRFTELSTSKSFELDRELGRLYIWGIACKAFLFFGSMGSGLGTFHYAHLPFQDPIVNKWYYHAESLYAQALVELGWIGILGIVATFVLVIHAVRKMGRPHTAVRSSKNKDIAEQYHAIFLVGLTLSISQAVHSIFDFALIVPAVFLPAGLLIGMVLGAARNRSRAETRTAELNSGNLILDTRGTSVPFVESSRFPSLQPTAQLPASPTIFWTKETGFTLVGCVGLLLFLWTSLKPIDAMCRVDAMNHWLQDQSKAPRTSRLGSPSAFLAGLWGTPDVSIYQAPDALRFLGESILYEFRTQRLDKMESPPNELPSVTWEKTSPLLLRLALTKQEAEAKLKGMDREAFDRSADFDALMGSSQQLARWNKSLELIERAHLKSPLDWRLVWGRLLLDRNLTISEWNGWFDRTSMIARHRPDTLFQLGVLAWQAAEDQKHVYPLWEFAMQLSPSLVPNTASLIALTTSDKDIPVEIFPLRPDYLNDIVNKPFNSTAFPITNEKLWHKIHDSSLELSPDNAQRYMWLAGAAAHFGDTEKEVEYLRELVDRSPMNRLLRMHLAERLGALGDFDPAIEHAEACLKMAPGDPQIEASLKRLKSLAVQSKQRE
jgi:tetratricopeptide (TPR) repeat protein